MESLVAGGLQVKQREFVICAVLGFMADGLEQCRGSVKLRINSSSNAFRYFWLAHLRDKESVKIEREIALGAVNGVPMFLKE